MRYLEAFCLPSEADEDSILLHDIRLDMGAYAINNVYPFRIFPQKELQTIDMAPITVFYGSNGSGKSTLLNIIAQKLRLRRSSPYNRTPFFDTYLDLTRAYLPGDRCRDRPLPPESCIITSDDVFDFMLNLRSMNNGVDRDRERLFREWDELRKDRSGFQMRTLEDYETVVRHREAASSTRSAYTARRLPQSLPGQSNGESAYGYFADKIRGHALYLLDEPENSLSAERQIEFARFLTDSARFYDCQFILSTHSPFLLSMPGARIYDLDTVPVRARKWTELSNVRLYRDFFEAHRAEFTE